MKCKAAQYRLLFHEDPARPTGPLREHLRDCVSCQQWQQRLIQLESRIALLPVPSPRSTAEAVERFLNEAPAVPVGRSSKTPPPILSLGHASPPHRRLIPRYRWYAALAATAALFVLVFDWAVLHRGGSPKPNDFAARQPRDRFVAVLVERDLRLARAESPKRRLEILADMADELHGQTRHLVHEANADELRRLAGLYDRLVREGIVKGAPALPMADRADVLAKMVERLVRAGQEASREASEIPEPPGDALRLIAEAARQGSDQLRELSAEAVP